ncbi:MAG: tetratricopeptide repeat protein [Myxococcales bacterium]
MRPPRLPAPRPPRWRCSRASAPCARARPTRPSPRSAAPAPPTRGTRRRSARTSSRTSAPAASTRPSASLEQECVERPSDDVAHYGLGLAYYAKSAGSEAKAIEHLAKAAELRPELAEYPFRLGVAHLEAERYAEAVAALKKARDLEPSAARHHVPLALALSRTGDRKGAIDAIRAILPLSPEPRDLEVARKVMARITDPFHEFPKAIQSDFERGLESLEKLDAPQQAIVAFEEILEKFPDLAVVHAALGLCFARLDDSGRAMDEFNRALALNPEDPRNHLYVADLYFSRERLDRAAEGYKAVLLRDPLSDRAYERLGAIAAQRGNAAEAAEWLKLLVVLRPGDLQARHSYGMALLGSGSLDAAGREFDLILQKDAKNIEAMLRSAMVDVARFKREKDPALASAARERATKRLEQVLDLQPQNVFAAKTLQELK